MDILHIIEELAYDMGQLPREAIESAIARRKIISPYLLEILEDAIARVDEVVEHDNYQGHLYAMYLLAQFREKRAYPLILQLFSFPGDLPHQIAGDVLTEDLHRILANVCDSNIGPLCEIIQDGSKGEYVRAACLETLVTLVGCNIIPRGEVLSYFQSLFMGELERSPSFVWDQLISCCCDLYPEELFASISLAYHERLIDESFISLEDVASILTERKERHLVRLTESSELIEDTVTEMEKWLSVEESYCF